MFLHEIIPFLDVVVATRTVLAVSLIVVGMVLTFWLISSLESLICSKCIADEMDLPT